MSEVDTNTQQLMAKIQAVASQVGNVNKNGNNSFQGYKYATEADLLEEVRPLLQEQKLIILPTTRSSVVVPMTTGKGEDNPMTVVEVEYRIIDTDTGTSVSCVFPGWGQDKGDKGGYKAYTGSMKYFLMKTFQVPTGDDPEAESPGYGPGNSSSSSSSSSSGGGTQRRFTRNKSAATDSAPVCENCGTEIKDSAKYSAAALVEMSKRNNDGHVFCYSCSQKAKG